MKAMVLAAGLGARLRPLTADIPKPLLPLGPCPLIVWNLCLLRTHGIRDVMINLHHLGGHIRRALGDGSSWHMRLRYSEEPALLGTGGGIKRAEAFFHDGPFLVLNGDTVADIDLSRLASSHRRNGALATMALRDDAEAESWGVIETDREDRVLRIHGRGRAAHDGDGPPRRRMFAGIHMMDPRLLRRVPPGEASSILDAYTAWLEQDALVSGYVFSGYWADVGTPERYAQAQRDVAAGLLTLPGQPSAPARKSV